MFLGGGGTVLNGGTAALISGGHDGVVSGSTITTTLTNQGTISGGFAGVYLVGDGDVFNAGSAAAISGVLYGVRIDTPLDVGAIVTNAGTISGGTAAVSAGPDSFAPMTVGNEGTITGGTFAVKFGNSNGNVFREYPGAVVTGIVAGGTGVDTLAFGAGVGLGTFSGIGNQFTGFEVLELDPHANWRAIGADTLATSATIRLSGAAMLRVAGTLVAPANLTMAGLGTLVAATTGHIGHPNRLHVLAIAARYAVAAAVSSLRAASPT